MAGLHQIPPTRPRALISSKILPSISGRARRSGGSPSIGTPSRRVHLGSDESNNVVRQATVHEVASDVILAVPMGVVQARPPAEAICTPEAELAHRHTLAMPGAVVGPLEAVQEKIVVTDARAPASPLLVGPISSSLTSIISSSVPLLTLSLPENRTREGVMRGILEEMSILGQDGGIWCNPATSRQRWTRARETWSFRVAKTGKNKG